MKKILRYGLPLIVAGSLTALVLSSDKPKTVGPAEATKEYGVPFSVSVGYGNNTEKEKYMGIVDGKEVELSRDIVVPFGNMIVQYVNEGGTLKTVRTGNVKQPYAIGNISYSSIALESELHDGDNEPLAFGTKEGKLVFLENSSTQGFYIYKF